MIGLLLPLITKKNNNPPNGDIGFKIVESLGDIKEDECVVIGRAGMKVPTGWDLVIVSSVQGYYGPRELNRLLEGIVASLKSNPERAIVIACPEYLSLHNGFESFIKFIHAVRDYSILHGGRVYLVTDPGFWDSREYSLLKTLEV